MRPGRVAVAEHSLEYPIGSGTVCGWIAPNGYLKAACRQYPARCRASRSDVADDRKTLRARELLRASCVRKRPSDSQSVSDCVADDQLARA